MLEAGLWGLLGQASLILGAWLSLQLAIPRQWLGLITGFGAGTLVAAAAFELSVPAYQEAGGPRSGLWIAVGAITFYVADRAVARRAPKGEHGSTGIALGALLDGVPESVAIAISLISGATVSTAMVVAVLVSNLPEGMASTPGFIRSGWSKRRVLELWLGIALAGGIAAALGYAVLGEASGAVLGAVQAFAAGTILTMLASVMMPTAYAEEGAGGAGFRLRVRAARVSHHLGGMTMTLQVVGAGLGRTGTASLKAALEQLLDGRCYHMMEVFGRPDDAETWRLACDGERTDWDELLGEYTATVDWPAAAFWRELSTAYPDAIVLLSSRDADEWWKSASNTIFEAMTREPPPGTPIEAQRTMILSLLHSRFALNWDDPDSAKLAYLQHNAEVRESIPAHRLVEWHPGDDWGPLCAALRRPEPDAPFPHVNSTQEFRLMAGLDEPG